MTYFGWKLTDGGQIAFMDIDTEANACPGPTRALTQKEVKEMIWKNLVEVMQKNLYIVYVFEFFDQHNPNQRRGSLLTWRVEAI